MLDFISQNIANILIGAGILTVIVLIVVNLIKGKRMANQPAAAAMAAQVLRRIIISIKAVKPLAIWLAVIM